jgi:hypothetical protein
MRGGPDLGALTLGRWFSAHVFLLPVTLVTLIAAHIALMRKHGISGPLRAIPGPGAAFFPWHVVKDTVMMAAVFASLFAVAALVPGASRRDRESLRRELRSAARVVLSLAVSVAEVFPGPLEPIATMVVPGVVGWGSLASAVCRSRSAIAIRGRHRDAHSRRRSSCSAQALAC